MTQAPQGRQKYTLYSFPRRRRKNFGVFGAFRLIFAVRILTKRWREQLTHEIAPKSIQLPKIPPADGLGTRGGKIRGGKSVELGTRGGGKFPPSPPKLGG